MQQGEYRRVPGFGGGWILGEDGEEFSSLAEMEWLSDRAAAIVGGSFLEGRLQSAIENCLPNPVPKVVNELFKDTGPIGAFGPKIDLALTLGILSGTGHADITQIKKIRNKFAHDLTVRTFDVSPIKEHCLSLKLIDRFIVTPTETHPNDTTDPSTFKIALTDWRMVVKNPRYRFFLAVNCYSSALAAAPGSDRPYL